MKLPLKKSETYNWVSGGKAEFTELEVQGPGGGRRVIDGVWLNVSMSATVATASLLQRDLARLFKTVSITQRGGRKRWNLTGLESRIMSQILVGSERHPVFADVATASPATVTYQLYIPLAKIYAKRGKDFAMPADCLDKIEVEYPSATDLSIGSSVVTPLSGTYWLMWDCHEDKPGEVIHYSEDEVSATNYTSATESFLKVRGIIHDLVLCRPGTATGGSAVSFTDFRSESLGIEQVTQTELANYYKFNRGAGGTVTIDPVNDGKASVLICSHGGLSGFHGRVVSSPLLKLSGNAATDLRAVYRQIVGKDESTQGYVAGEYRTSGVTMVKTAGKTRKLVSDGWTENQVKILPAKAA